MKRTLKETKEKDEKSKLKVKAKAKAKELKVTPPAAEEEEDLDDIFGGLSKAKKQQKQEKESNLETDALKKAEERKRKDILVNARAEREATGALASTTTSGSSGKFAFQDPSVHRVTTDGLPVYKYFHLGMKQDDGGTPNCPFDCDCCF